MFPGIFDEILFIGDCRMWKVEAFKDIKKDFNEDVKFKDLFEKIVTNMICLGDS
jgi:hypothetical protein